MPTAAKAGFDVSSQDADQLFALYDGEPIHSERSEVLKRASLILLVTAWETYIEDFLKESFAPLLASARAPSNVQAAFDSVARKWIAPGKVHTPEMLAHWTGDGWKKQIESYFQSEITKLNTPDSKNCILLFKQFLKIDLADYWHWKTYAFKHACERLDKIIKIRGHATHTARKSVGNAPSKHIISRPDLESSFQFMKELVSATDGICSHLQSVSACKNPTPRK